MHRDAGGTAGLGRHVGWTGAGDWTVKNGIQYTTEQDQEGNKELGIRLPVQYPIMCTILAAVHQITRSKSTHAT